MQTRKIEFTATKVNCFEALDWEIVQVTFGTAESGIEEADRTSPYLLINVNFEFGSEVGMEFYDGEDYQGDALAHLALWRNRVIATSKGGCEFDICLHLSDTAFAELREYLRIILRADFYQE